MASEIEQQADPQLARSRYPWLQASLTLGFAAAAGMWCVWFVAHLPGVALPTPVTTGLMLGLLGACTAIGSKATPKPWLLGFGAGLVSGLLNTMLISMVMGEVDGTTPEAAATVRVLPDAQVMLGGFILLSVVVGTVGGALGGLIRNQLGENQMGENQPEPTRSLAELRQLWLARSAIVAIVATAPLLLVGGLVTSTGAGMSVPDWPNSYGANMFLYPLALMGDHRIYFEHSHRLLGTFVGLATLALSLQIVLIDRRRWVQSLAVVAFILVCFQGLLGGKRVTMSAEALGMVHGITAQLFLALLVMQAAWLSPLWRSLDPTKLEPSRRLKFATTGLLHSTILQLAMGAAYRHFGRVSDGAQHALWAHVVFSVVVVIFAALAASAAISLVADGDPRKKMYRKIGLWIGGVVAVQFLMGWVALVLVLTTDRSAPPTAEQLEAVPYDDFVPALVATAHQANGALLLALAALGWVWVKRRPPAGAAVA